MTTALETIDREAQRQAAERCHRRAIAHTEPEHTEELEWQYSHGLPALTWYDAVLRRDREIRHEIRQLHAADGQWLGAVCWVPPGGRFDREAQRHLTYHDYHHTYTDDWCLIADDGDHGSYYWTDNYRIGDRCVWGRSYHGWSPRYIAHGYSRSTWLLDAIRRAGCQAGYRLSRPATPREIATLPVADMVADCVRFAR